ncbi:hypothetical protein HYT74_02220 [Candidatus Daviesbacteria bacterium]|nr:hypothetical protein [Candidatus Daviesbacteria bacterium]
MINLLDFRDFFIFLGGLLIIGGIIYLLLRNRFESIFISEEEISKIKIPIQNSSRHQSIFQVFSNLTSDRLAKQLSMFLFFLIIVVFLLNQFLMLQINNVGSLGKLLNINISITKK